VEPFCSAIRSDTAISELPSTICTSTGMSRMALLPPIPARPGASAASSLRTSRSSSIALLSSSSSTSGVAASALLISILLGPPSGGQQFLDQLALGVVWLDDAHGVVLPEPAELAGEKCSPARGQLGLSRRCLRDFEQLPDLQPRELAECHARQRDRGAEADRRAHDLLAEVLAPLRAGPGRGAAFAARFQQHALRHRHRHLASAVADSKVDRDADCRPVAYDLLCDAFTGERATERKLDAERALAGSVEGVGDQVEKLGCDVDLDRRERPRDRDDGQLL